MKIETDERRYDALSDTASNFFWLVIKIILYVMVLVCIAIWAVKFVIFEIQH